MNTRAYYEWDSENNKYRWYVDCDPGDVFDLIDIEELELRKKAAPGFRMRVTEGMPEDE